MRICLRFGGELVEPGDLSSFPRVHFPFLNALNTQTHCACGGIKTRRRVTALRDMSFCLWSYRGMLENAVFIGLLYMVVHLRPRYYFHPFSPETLLVYAGSFAQA